MQPVILGQTQVSSALRDPAFATAVPELAHIKHTLERSVSQSGRGCSSCRRRREQRAAFSSFTQEVLALSPEARLRLKRYLGADALMVNHVDPRTRQAKVEIL